MTSSALRAVPFLPAGQAATATGGWCAGARSDPITGLVAFPDLHTAFPRHLAESLRRGAAVGLAIGDVDQLKTYVETANTEDSTNFGHLAGNALMADLGAVTRHWFDTAGFERACASTFGGDEVIVVAETTTCAAFRTCVTTLRDRLRASLPRPVSFAFSVLAPATGDRMADADRYLRLVSGVDRALFAGKASRATRGEGFVLNASTAAERR